MIRQIKGKQTCSKQPVQRFMVWQQSSGQYPHHAQQLDQSVYDKDETAPEEKNNKKKTKRHNRTSQRKGGGVCANNKQQQQQHYHKNHHQTNHNVRGQSGPPLTQIVFGILLCSSVDGDCCGGYSGRTHGSYNRSEGIKGTDETNTHGFPQCEECQQLPFEGRLSTCIGTRTHDEPTNG